MSTEKRPSTADEIAKLIHMARHWAAKEYADISMDDHFGVMADALEAQADQLKQAREIIEKVRHDLRHLAECCEDEDVRLDLTEMLKGITREWDANPAPATESEHGND